MLSLSPRADQFRFLFPKDYFPKEVLDKYDKLFNKNQAVIKSSIDYINESVAGVTFPGIQDLIHEQPQVARNIIHEVPSIGGKINIEPHHPNHTYSSANPLDQIEKEFKVSMRKNQGLLNYWMMYETIFHRIIKPELFEHDREVFTMFILDEMGVPVIKVLFYQPKIDGLEGLDFSYDKIERQKETFDVTFKFNNIDIDFCAK